MFVEQLYTKINTSIMAHEERYNRQHESAEIFSKAVKAGKRTYFFDVKATRGNDYYLTITESKKRFDEEGNFQFEKHKLFLYKEDFDKFADGLQEIIDFIRSREDYQPPQYQQQNTNHDNIVHLNTNEDRHLNGSSNLLYANVNKSNQPD